MNRRALSESLREVFASPQAARALTLAIIGTLVLANAIHNIVGWPGFFAILGGELALAITALVVTWSTIEWRGLLPLSLLVFVGWCALSLLWSDYQWATIGGVLYLVIVAFLAVYVGLSRDLIQVIRAFGDVFRFALTASLVLEVFSGLLIDSPIKFLGIQGNLASGGPIQGLMGSRNLLALIALIAVVTFFVELITKSATRQLAIFSLALGGLCILFTRSPVAFGTLLILVLAALCLLGMRAAKPASRRVLQIALLAAIGIGLITAFVFRSPIIRLLNAESEFETRYLLWQQILVVSSARPVEGYGFIGSWRRELAPFVSFNGHSSALNAFLDSWLQVGIVGLALLLALLALALVRSWLLGSSKPSVVYIWPALVLIVLVVVSAAESTVLTGIGWFALVICTLKASQELSWRRRLPEPS